MACKYYGNCEHQSGWCQSDSMLIKCTYGLNNLCSERIQKIVKLEEENKELKRLLRLAVEDFETLSDEVVSEDCDFNLFCKSCPFSSNDDYINCAKKWKHAEEAMKLLGDDADD